MSYFTHQLGFSEEEHADATSPLTAPVVPPGGKQIQEVKFEAMLPKIVFGAVVVVLFLAMRKR